MTNSVKMLLREGLGAIGDRANRRGCPIILYQPQECRRGERRKNDISKGEAADR